MESILVLGGGSAGLISALTIKRRNPLLKVRVIRSPEIGIIGVGEGTTVDFPRHFFQYLKLDPAGFFHEAEPAWKLGIRFLWGDEPGFFYSFGVEFDHRFRNLPMNTGFYHSTGNLFVGESSCLMAHDKAFPHMPDGSGPNLSIPHGYHIENIKLVAWLEKVCLELGVTIDEDTITRIEHEGETVTALHTAGGETVTADLYVDASGFRSEILGRTFKEPFISYSDSLFCDRAVIAGWSRGEDDILHPYTTAETMDAGWCWQIEHDQWVNRGYVYSSEFISDEDALAEFRRKNSKIENEPRMVKFVSGRYGRGWVGNVVAVGNSAGFVEPLEATALHVLCSQSRRIADLLLDRCPLEPTPTAIAIYNRLNADAWEEIRDFLAAHYAFNTRLDTPFWKACREKTNLAGAQPIVDFYRENGPSLLMKAMIPQNTFGMDGYLAILCGQHVPHAHPYRPTPEEQEKWEKNLHRLSRETRHAMDPREAMAAVLSRGIPAANQFP